MRIQIVLLLSCVALTGACKKGGGGGGSWLVGERGLMSNIDETGHLGRGYDIGTADTLNGIACRYLDEAWVVGDRGTLLYTADAGASWVPHDLGTTANLRALATQDAGPVFVAGDGVFFTANPSFGTGDAQWSQLADGATSFRSLAAAQAGTTVLAVSEDGGLWRYDGTLRRVATIDGARAVAVSPNGALAIVAGDGLARSSDGGLTWTPVAVDPTLHFQAIRIDNTGDAVAVGTNGVVARIDLDGRVLTQTIGNVDLTAVHVLGYEADGYAAGVGGQTFLTHDGGWTWKPGPDLGRTALSVDEIGDGHN